MTLSEIHKVWIEIAEELNGQLQFGDYLQANVKAGIITAKIEYEFKGYKIEIHQGIFERGKGGFDFNPIIIQSEIESRFDFDLTIWRMDFFDRLFGANRIRTGYRAFDKKIWVKSTSKAAITKFFSNEKIRNELLADKMIHLHIDNKEEKWGVILKIFRAPGKIKTIEHAIFFFESIITQLEKF